MFAKLILASGKLKAESFINEKACAVGSLTSRDSTVVDSKFFVSFIIQLGFAAGFSFLPLKSFVSVPKTSKISSSESIFTALMG